MKPALIISLFAIVFLGSCAKNEVTNIKLNKSTSNLVLGQTDSLITTLTVNGDIKNVPQTWTSSNSNVATVSSSGFINALSKGATIITVEAGGKTATCLITVDDKIVTSFNTGALIYWGDYYKTGKSNNYILYLLNSTDTLLLEVNTDLKALDSIPSGTYNMITNVVSSNYNQFIPNTLVPANFTDYSGSWFYTQTIFTPVINGNAIITNTKNNYTIQYNLIDYFGNSLSGTYQGSLVFYDSSAQTSPALKSKIKTNKLIMKLSDRLHLKR